MADSDTTPAQSGVGGSGDRPGGGHGDYQGASHLVDHVAVTKPDGRGLLTGDLASFQEAFADYANSRMKGTGGLEYADEGGQRSLSYPPQRLALELVDELADSVNYLSMLAIKVLALVDNVEKQKSKWDELTFQPYPLTTRRVEPYPEPEVEIGDYITDEPPGLCPAVTDYLGVPWMRCSPDGWERQASEFTPVLTWEQLLARRGPVKLLQLGIKDEPDGE